MVEKMSRSDNRAYFGEMGWRFFYTFIAFLRCAVLAWDEGADVLRERAMEPWFDLWGGETRFYSEPGELSDAELVLSLLVGVRLVLPLAGAHVIVFLSNGLRKHERSAMIRVWVAGWILLWGSWYLMVEHGGVSLLMDISHVDEYEYHSTMLGARPTVSLVYVPTLGAYRGTWGRLRVFRAIFSQLPLLWLWRAKGIRLSGAVVVAPRNIGQLANERLRFLTVFALPVLASALLLVDELRTGVFIRVLLRVLYLGILLLYTYIRQLRIV
jgi:hypothetical protein